MLYRKGKCTQIYLFMSKDHGGLKNFMIKDKRKVFSVVEKKDHNYRIDQYLSRRFNYHSRKEWQELISQGIILIEGVTCKASKMVKTGDIVEFIIDDYKEPEASTNYEIIYEDDYMLAINKPPNSICHPVGPYFKNTLSFKIAEDKGNLVHLINRLDRETTGIVLFGKDPKTAKYLTSLFFTKHIYKEYVVVVHGRFPGKLYAKGYLLQDNKSLIRKKRKFVKNIEEAEIVDYETAETSFELIKLKNNLSLVKVMPKTGRLHQIRATLCSLGHPVVGDKMYGLDETIYLRFIDHKMTEEDKKLLILNHQALHAKKIIFIHPKTQQNLIIEVVIPAEITDLF